jgi:hypothetical protein
MKSIFFILLFIITFNIQAQPPHKFYTRIGGNGYDVGYDVKQTLDNGYIITGSTSSMGVGNTDMYLLKLDSMGQIKFQSTFGNANNDIGKSVIQLIDSSYVIVGYTNSIGFGGYDIFLVKVDKYGSLVWQKTIGGTDWDFANSLQQTSDGGFIIAGSTYSYGYGNADGYVVKTDANGTITWSKTYGGANDDEFKSIIQTTDGGYALCGYTKSYGDINGDAWVFKLLTNGDSAWSKTYGGVKEDFTNKIIQVQNSNLVVAGGTRSIPTSTSTVEQTMLVKYDVVNGNQLYNYIDPVGYEEYYNSIAEGINGSFVGCGRTKNFVFGYQAIVDVYGIGFSYLNFYSFATGNNDEFFSVCKTRDKGFALVGSTQGTFPTLQDVMFLKIDSVGNYGNSITSLKNIELKYQDLTVFPNPSTESININLSTELDINKSYFKIIDVNGNEVLSNNIYYHHSKIDISYLSSGLYFFQLYNEIGLLKTLKISVIK